MKTIRNTIIAGLAVLTISLSAYAADGHVLTGGKTEIRTDTSVAAPKSLTSFPAIFFSPDKAVIDKAQYRKIDEIVLYMNEYPETTLLVKGWTDENGTEESNERLSQERADHVKERLVSSGISSWRIIAIGMGENVIGSDADTSRKAESEIISFR